MENSGTLVPQTTTVRATIDQLAECYSDAPFLLSPETKGAVSFRQLQEQARKLSYHLLSLGLTKGEKVAFLLDNGLFSAQLLLGAMYGGFVPVPVNTVAGAAQVAHVLHHSDAKVVFASAEHQPLLFNVISQVGCTLHIISAHPDHGPDWYHSGTSATTLPPLHRDDEDLLIYTSGSTAQAKGVVFTQRNLLAGVHNTIAVYQFTPQDRSLSLLPLYHLNALTATLLPMLLSGGSVVMPHRFRVSHVWQWVAEYHCTWFAAVPTILTHLVNWTDPSDRENMERLHQFRFIRSSSAPLAPALHRTVEEKFPLLLVEAMGMTEAGEVFLTPPSRTMQKVGSPGLPCHETRIVDEDGHPLPVGRTGEILIRSPRIMKGYYKNPQATAEVLSADGWLRTGDLGYRDADGYYFIVGRAKEIVIKGGENIAPREIDDTLMRHPAVLEAAALGIPDPYLGEDLVAYVVLKPGSQCSASELLNHCAQTLGEFKTPSRVYFVTDLPKGPSGKVQRLKLLERHTTSTTAQSITSSLQVPVNHLNQTTRDWHRSVGAKQVPAHDTGYGYSVGPCFALTQRCDHDTLGSWSALDPQHSGTSTPRTAVEEQLMAIWEKVLQRTPIRISDNFFALGGHSLLAASILARVRETFQVNLPLRVLFEAPTVAELAEHIAAARHNGDTIPLPPVQSLPLDREIPLSFAQQRLWFLHQLDPQSTEYNIATAHKFIGPLNPQILEQSLFEIIQRHASLRTTFPVINEQPIQSIALTLPFSLTKVDLSTFTTEQRATAVGQYAQEEAQRPFNLATGPLLRATLLRLTDQEHVLLVTMHHIISDRWSMEVFFWELSTLYAAFIAHQPSPLPQLPIQYADLATWQRQRLQGSILDQHLAYWRQQLHNTPPFLALPTDHPRPPVQSHRGAHQRSLLPLALTHALNELSRREGTTLFMTLLAAFQVLLFRYTDQDDIVVGSPSANRTCVETEQLIGFFINMLVLRSNLSGNPAFREALQRVREVALAAYTHQVVPFEKLVEELRPERVLHYSPLFQVVFHLRNVPAKPAEFPDVQMEVLRYESGIAQFDLTFVLRETPDGLEVEVEYATDLFEEDTIKRLIGHYQTLLEGIVANPDQPIATLPLLAAKEQHQLLVAWNNTKRDYPREVCLHQLLEAQVGKTPDAVAVVFDTRQLTYRELNNQANQLAHYLRTLGVGPGVLVGICIERSFELLVGLLGILKAGAAYVPFDSDQPQDRSAFMLHDSQVPVLLTQSFLQQQLPQGQAQLVCLDSDWQKIASESTIAPVTEVTADNLAYVIYTSGSTGTPKGAAITHRGICNRLRWMQETYQLTHTDRVLQKTPCTFDVSVWEFFWPLMSGARVILARPQGHRAPQYLVHLITEQQITALHFVPSMLRIFLEEPTVAYCHSLRQVFCSGEALSLELQQCFCNKVPARIANLYGPTEAAVEVTHWPCEQGDTRGFVPVGRPIANTQIYLLDSLLQPVPVGIPGELYIGGVQVGQGYLNRPELTAEKFIADPFSSIPGARLYKTGDVARYHADGIIEFLGRNDDQVKLRGLRIELGEIATVLGHHPAIQQAIVLLREDRPDDQRLVAYVAPSGGQNVSHRELQSFLHERLPEYMIPAAFVVLDTFPLTTSGKIDRQALPAPSSMRPELAPHFIAPRTPEEEGLAGIWREVLGLEHVGIHDNFFALGGHSLKATQVIVRLQRLFDVEIPLRRLFETPTIAGLAPMLVRHHGQTPLQAHLAQAVAALEELTEEEAARLLAQPEGAKS